MLAMPITCSGARSQKISPGSAAGKKADAIGEKLPDSIRGSSANGMRGLLFGRKCAAALLQPRHATRPGSANGVLKLAGEKFAQCLSWNNANMNCIFKTA